MGSSTTLTQGQKLPVVQHLPPQRWRFLLQVTAPFFPGCIITNPFDVSGCNSIRGLVHTDALRTAVQLHQLPFGATIAPQADVVTFRAGVDSVPIPYAVKMQYMLKHPFVAFAFNATVVTNIRACLFGVPIDFQMQPDGVYP